MVGDNSKNKKISIIGKILESQRRAGVKILTPRPGDRIGFVFSTKDRVNFTLQSLLTVDQEKGFDIIWVDGSETKEGKELPTKYQFKNANLAEVHFNIRGGPDKAICFGLKRLLDLGYDYCGLIENDIIFQPGWFGKLITLFHSAAQDGLVVGAATVRNYESRVLEYRSKYTINWNIGAGMILFSRPAAQLILSKYPSYPITARKLYRFYAELASLDLKGIWDLWQGHIDRRLSPDWAYEMILYKHGLACVGSIPCLINDLEFDVNKARRTNYATLEKADTGIAHPMITKKSLWWLRFADVFFNLGWMFMKMSMNRKIIKLLKDPRIFI